MRKVLRYGVFLLASAAGAATASQPLMGVPSPAAKARSHFGTTFYTMRWDAPDMLDYEYRNGELALHVQHFGSGAESANLLLRVRADRPGRYPMPGSGSAAFRVLGCEHSVGGSSYVQITRMDVEHVEGRFELQGHCAKLPAASETLRDGVFRLVFDKPTG